MSGKMILFRGFRKTRTKLLPTDKPDILRFSMKFVAIEFPIASPELKVGSIRSDFSRKAKTMAIVPKTMASRSRREVALEAFQQKMTAGNSSARIKELKKLLQTATMICDRLRQHREKFPGYSLSKHALLLLTCTRRCSQVRKISMLNMTFPFVQASHLPHLHNQRHKPFSPEWFVTRS